MATTLIKKQNPRFELGTSQSLRMQVARKKNSHYPNQGSIGIAYILGWEGS